MSKGVKTLIYLMLGLTYTMLVVVGSYYGWTHSRKRVERKVASSVASTWKPAFLPIRNDFYRNGFEQIIDSTKESGRFKTRISLKQLRNLIDSLGAHTRQESVLLRTEIGHSLSRPNMIASIQTTFVPEESVGSE